MLNAHWEQAKAFDVMMNGFCCFRVAPTQQRGFFNRASAVLYFVVHDCCRL